MRLPPYDQWIFAKLLAGQTINGEMEAVSEDFKKLANHLNRLQPETRPAAWEVALCSPGLERDTITRAIAEVDPNGSAPEVDQKSKRRANLGDIRKAMSGIQWLWTAWIPGSRLSGISGSEGIGKTRFGMDLARRIWHGLEWPDGQPASLPPGTPTLWLCSDGQHDDLVSIAEAYGMPDESVIYNALPESPYDRTTIDGEESVAWLEESIIIHGPGLVFIDSLTFATSRDLCQANHVKDLMAPLRDVTQRTQTPIISLLHVSKDGDALGKRIKGITRIILNLSQPDPEQKTRLRLAVTKSFAKKPPDLGATMDDNGFTYDSSPPTAPETSGPGRPPEARTKARKFIRESLNRANGRLGTDLRSEWTKSGGAANTFNRAVNEMKAEGELMDTGGPGTGSQWSLHLTNPELDPEHPF